MSDKKHLTSGLKVLSLDEMIKGFSELDKMDFGNIKKPVVTQSVTLASLYKQWCTETKRGGAILIGGSIREFFNWVDQQGFKISK